MTGGTSTAGQEPAANEGAGYDREILDVAGSPERITPIGEETSSIAIKAGLSNSGTIYVGWNENVDSGDGFPLDTGEGITLDLDIKEQGVYVVADTANDEVRWIALG